MNNNQPLGLSSGNKKVLVVLLFVVLLIFGPIEPYGLVVRTAYLIVLPILLWFSLGYFGRKWEIDDQTNDRLFRAILGIIAGAMFVGAYLSLTSKYHSECTQSVQTRDGTECVGDYISVPGADKSGAFILIILGATAAYYAISKHKEES